MRLLALFLLAALTAHAQRLVVDPLSIDPGHSTLDAVTVHAIGVLTLTAPGTYTATSWTFNGELRLEAPGNYTLVASTGSIVFNRSARLRSLDGTGTVQSRLTCTHAGDFSFDAIEISGRIAVSQGRLNLDGPPLANLSTRAVLAAGQTHTSGFVIGGNIPRRVLVRAIGPTLATFGVANPLATPVLTVFANQTPLRSNAGWNLEPQVEAVGALVGAFPLPFASRDAAMLVTLNPGVYTVQVGGGAGEMLLEIYWVD